jgi:voltage-gated potassium channel
MLRAGTTWGAANYTGMGTQAPGDRVERWLDKRMERKGLRPRDAAYLIGTLWAIAVVVFGIVERLVDPKTFHSVWLGMWWAVETVTTVGYGDIVPDQTIGKVIGCFLMLGGLSLISVVTAAITSGFVARAEALRRAAGDDPVVEKLDQLALELQSIKAELDQLRAPTDGDDRS